MDFETIKFGLEDSSSEILIGKPLQRKSLSHPSVENQKVFSNALAVATL